MRIKQIQTDIPPRIEDGVVFVSTVVGRSFIYYDSMHFIAVDWVGYSKEAKTWYFFLDGQEVLWDDLSDEKRFLVRRQAIEWNTIMGMGGYKDEGWKVLEGLESL